MTLDADEFLRRFLLHVLPRVLCVSVTSACLPIATVASSCSYAVPISRPTRRHPLRLAWFTSAQTVTTASCGSLPHFLPPNFPTGWPMHHKRRTLHDPHLPIRPDGSRAALSCQSREQCRQSLQSGACREHIALHPRLFLPVRTGQLGEFSYLRLSPRPAIHHTPTPNCLSKRIVLHGGSVQPILSPVLRRPTSPQHSELSSPEHSR